MTSIKDWKILDKTYIEFVAIFIFIYLTIDVLEENVIFNTTSSECVYGFGVNKYGSVGLGHTLALTKTGHIYSWGRNNSGQLGNGDTDDCFTPKRIKSLNTISNSNIRCGGYGHCLALTFDGKIYSCGNNNYGQTGLGDRVGPHITPNQVIAVNAFKIVAIDCGYYHSLALTDDGFVYAFGDNELGQTGVGKKRTCFIPVRIKLKNTRISKISCGEHHCLLMSTDGDCYAFGNGQYGQIGDGNHLNKFVPIKIAMPLKCVDIATINNTDISMVKLDDGFWRVWGKCCDNKSYAMQIKIDHQNVKEVIINFPCYKVSYEPIHCDNTSRSVITARFIDSSDNPKYCDISFKIGDKVIHAQKQYLISVCRHFESMVADISGGQVIIDDYSNAVYYAYLRYLYTGSVDMKVEHLFDLIDLAKCYSEDELKEKCVQHIIKNTTLLKLLNETFYNNIYKIEQNMFGLQEFFGCNTITSVVTSHPKDTINPEKDSNSDNKGSGASLLLILVIVIIVLVFIIASIAFVKKLKSSQSSQYTGHYTNLRTNSDRSEYSDIRTIHSSTGEQITDRSSDFS